MITGKIIYGDDIITLAIDSSNVGNKTSNIVDFYNKHKEEWDIRNVFMFGNEYNIQIYLKGKNIYRKYYNFKSLKNIELWMENVVI